MDSNLFVICLLTAGINLIGAAIKERFEAIELVIYEAGAAICTHTGTGWGVIIVPDE